MSQAVIQFLFDQGKIDQATKEVAENLVNRGKTGEQALVGGKYISEEDYAKAQAEVLGIPYRDLSEFKVDAEVSALIPDRILETFPMVPYSFKDNRLEVVLADPQNYQAVESLEFLCGEKGWTPVVSTAPTSQVRALTKGGSGGGEVATALEAVKGKFQQKKKAEEMSETLEEVIKGAPVSRMVGAIMRQAVDSKASDIHIEPFGNESRIRYRVDGILQTALRLPIYVHPALVSRIKVLANLKLDETRVPQDGRIRQEFGQKKIDFRISTLPVVDHEKVVMRILDTSAGAPELADLGFRKAYIDIILEEIKRPHGMMLITGPTGSGKSTTLFSALNLLNKEGVNISTLEDPVEYFIQGVNQSQIRPEIGFTFAAGLRALLRQDPNVIMVGEIRDKETGELAIHAALTGHLIFSTLHTNDVYGIVPRMLDMGIEPFLLAATINLGAAQRLARKICSTCKEPEAIPTKLEEKLLGVLQKIPAKFLDQVDLSKKIVFYKGKGCPKCKGTGYKGRTAIAELFRYTPNVQKLVESGFPREGFDREFKAQGMITLQEDLVLKAAEGLTSVEEMLRLSQETVEGEGK